MLTHYAYRARNDRSSNDSHSAILVCLLGGFRLLQGDRPLDILITGKGMALLSALALHLESGVPREVLLDQLWPEHDATQAGVSLNSLVYSLHRRLRDDAHQASAVLYAHGFYFLNCDAGYSTDIARFDALCARGRQLAAGGDDAGAQIAYQQGRQLYRGDLQVGSDLHAMIERERLRTSFLSVLAWLAQHAFQQGDYAVAVQQALQLLTADPCREDAHRLVMRAWVRQGERAQALRQYRLCEQVLRREFDASPEPLTTELFDRIRRDSTSV